MVAPTVSVLLTLQFTEYFSSLLEARSETNPVNSLVAEVTKIYVVIQQLLSELTLYFAICVTISAITNTYK